MLVLWGRSPPCRRGLVRLGPACLVNNRVRAVERGMVTAEFAVVLPAVVLVLALSVGALGLAVDQVRCVDAARAGARAASRGDSHGAVSQVVQRAASSAAVVSMVTSGEFVHVTVVLRPRVAGSLLPAWLRASSTSSAAREPTGSVQ